MQSIYGGGADGAVRQTRQRGYHSWGSAWAVTPPSRLEAEAEMEIDMVSPELARSYRIVLYYKWWIIVVGSILTFIVVCVGSLYWQEIRVEQFLRDPSSFGDLKTVTFTGQRRKVLLEDAESIRDLNTALKGSAYCSDGDLSGIVYTAHLTFVSGRNMEIQLMVCDATTITFTQGDPPKWRTLQLPANQPQRLRDVIHRLLSKDSMQLPAQVSWVN